MPIVLGGGIAGLSAGYYLLKTLPKHASSIKIFESSGRLGGWIRSESPAENVVFEHGARTLRPGGERGMNTLQLCSEIGLTDKVNPILSTQPAAKNRMIYVGNKLHPLPSSFFALFRKLPPFSKPLITALVHDLRMGKPAKQLSDESLYDFTERRFGTEIAKYAISAMICGICAGDAREISVKFLMKDHYEFERKFGSIGKGIINSMFNKKGTPKIAIDCNLVKRSQMEKWSIYSLQGGLQTLSDTLGGYLQHHDVDLRVNSPCRSIRFEDKRALVTIGNEEHTTDNLICSLPTHAVGPLVEKQHPVLAAELLNISHVDVAVVNLQYPGQWLKQPGFGFLIPPCENLPILGVIYDSCVTDMKDNTVLTVMMGGKWFEERLGKNISKEEVLKLATTQVENILKISVKPDVFEVNIHRKCIPQYVVGHHDRIQRIHKYIKDNKLPLRLCGSAYDGVGINDVIFSAKQAVNQI